MLDLTVSRHCRPRPLSAPCPSGPPSKTLGRHAPARTREGERSSLTHEDSATGTPTRADAVVEAVARRDFGCLAAALPDDVHLRALLPGGLREWHGRAGVNEAFTGWFDGFDEYELVDAEIGEVGPRLHLSW